MTIDEIIGFLDSLDGVLALRPGPGDGSPEIAWGDVFFYYAPDGQVPAKTQPFATIVTKDYPGDEPSGLDRPGAFRLNISAGTEAFTEWTGRTPREANVDLTSSAADTVIAHPVYAPLGWLAVIDPGPRTAQPIRDLLRIAHERARGRARRHSGSH
ncbi:DUF6194 family protein [Nocardia sp. NBC_00416]|uniref:DUF6194 family protein n=1 Tax=Nocardia sp. NBC_00416 TaxID=2975991 RepID=UPI002E1AA289